MEMSEILDSPEIRPIRKPPVVVRGLNPYPNYTTSSISTVDSSTRLPTYGGFPSQSPVDIQDNSLTPSGNNTMGSISNSTTPIQQSTNFLDILSTTFQTSASELTTGLQDYLTASTTMSQGIYKNSTSIWATTPSSIISDQITNKTLTDIEVENAYQLRVTLWQWMSPFIFLLGFFGNIAILIVLNNRPVMSDNTTSTYVKYLAIADLLTVITGIIPEWLIFTGIFDIEQCHPAGCKLYKFTAYTVSDASIWILTAFSVERFIAVVFPFKRQKGWCKVSQVKIICLSLVLLGVVKNLQSFWTRGAEYEAEGENGTLVLRSNCGYPTAADRHFNLYVRPWLVLMSINVIPMAILWFSNFSVIWTISRRHTVQSLQISSASKRASALAQQVTIMCLCASFSFIIFMTPSFILFIGKAYWYYDPVSKGPYMVAKAVNNQLMYINNSINFYLYLFSGERFRRSVISIFIKCQWRRKDLRNKSLYPSTGHKSTRSTTQSRKSPYNIAIVSNNGVPLKACPEMYDSSASCTPRGSEINLHDESGYV